MPGRATAQSARKTSRRGRRGRVGQRPVRRLAPEREDTSQGLADRLREAAAGLDRGALSKAAEALQQSREAEDRHGAQEVERLHAEELRLQRERDEHTHRLRGPHHGL